MKRHSASSPLRGSTYRTVAVWCVLALAASSRAQDSYEPDNTPQTARTITNGQVQNRSIYTVAVEPDVDWVTFTIGSSGATNLRIETAGVSGDTEMWLYGSQNLTKELLYADDGATGKFSLITLGTVAPGTYYIKVGAVGGGTVGAYALRATWADRSDAYESDNTAATAKAIANGETQERSIHVANDEDWATFTIGNNGATNLQIETAGITGDTELYLYGPNSSTAQLGYNDDSPGGKFSLITLNSLATGTYYIRVTSFGLSSAISGYTLRATWTDGVTSQPGDSYEPDDTAATATTIANGQIQNRSIHVLADVDWAKFTIGSNGATNVRIQTAGVSGDTEMWLYGPNSTTAQLDYNDDASGTTFSQISRGTLAAGTYYIKVAEFGSDRAISAYTLTVNWTDSVPVPPGDSFEVDDTPATAKSIANGQTQNRSIHVAGDVDWATLTIGANGASNVRIETAGVSGDTEMWLYGPNNATALLAYDDEGGGSGFSRIALNALGAGTYYVKVTDFGNNDKIAAYSLRASWTNGVPVATTGGRLVNLSIRSNAGVGSETIIIGFVTVGTGAKQFLLRGIGPTLATLGVTGALADPTLKLYTGSTVIVENDNWGAGGALRDAATAVGAFQLPDNSKDAALLQTLGAGAYTAQVGGGAGVALVETYEVGANAATRLTNLSARAQVGTGADILIAGFVIAGQGPRTLLVRAIGPGLTQFGVTGVLADPRLDIFSGSTLVQTNDNWGGTAALIETFTKVGAFALPAASRDAVLQVTLQPGAYSAQISGVGGTTGAGMVEVYEIP